MEAAINLSAIKIVFMLIQCVTHMHAACYSREYKLLPGGYNIYIQNGVQPVFNTTKVVNINDCGQMCADEKVCNVWRFSNGICQLFNSRKDKVTVKISTSKTTKTYYETGEDDIWMKVYYVQSGSGISVASTFLGNGFQSWIPFHCINKLCPEFFRSFFIDIWSSLPIMKVKFALFKNETEVLYVIFNGKGTNSQSWFTMSHVLESPWKDFYKGAAYVYFGINYNNQLSFYVGKEHPGCFMDSGWIAVIEPARSCKWHRHLAFPDILYSDKESANVWSIGRGTADALAVYISF